VTPLTSSMFFFKVFFSVFKYNPHYFFVSCVYYFACLLFSIVWLCFDLLLLIFILLSFAPHHCCALLLFFGSSLSCVVTILQFFIVGCYCSLLLCNIVALQLLAIGHYYFPLLCIVTSFQFFVVVHYHHSLKHLFDLLLLLGSSLMCVVVIPSHCCGLVTSIWYNPQPLLLSKWGRGNMQLKLQAQFFQSEFSFYFSLFVFIIFPLGLYV
jgi:hypothetical protein